MKLLLTIVVILLTLGLFWFVFENTTLVDVTLFGVTYEGVWLGGVVVMAVLVGAVLVGVLAVAEGAGQRLENRRLRRDLQKVSTEVNYLRTSPSAPAAGGPAPLAAVAGSAAASEGEVASAPVYGAEEGWSPGDPSGDDDDDFYSGGRAV